MLQTALFQQQISTNTFKEFYIGNKVKEGKGKGKTGSSDPRS